MRKIVKTIVFKVGLDIVASLEADKQTIQELEQLKGILAIEHNIFPDDIEVRFETKQVVEFLTDCFISQSGALCFYNELWNVERIEGLSYVKWLNLNTEEGINTLSDYQFLKKGDELVKFN